MAKAPFAVQPQLTAITLSYRNKSYIADAVLPRVPVLSQDFKYSQYTKEDSFTIEDTRVGRKGNVNQIDYSATEQSSSVYEYGLEDVIPGTDVLNAEATAALTGVQAIDPKARSTELVTDKVMLDRELRTANLVFNATTYPVGNKVVLAGASQWSDFAGSSPVDAISDALDGMLVRPNIGVIGMAVWSKLRRHPKVTAAVYANGGNASVSSTVVARNAVAELLELDEIIIGEGFYNTAKKGQAGVMQRLWGKHAAFLYRAPNILDTEGTVTFGATAQWGSRVAGTLFDENIGLEGSEKVRVGERVRELILAADAGYFFQNAVA
jgi:hypothetical protein